jgi:hypothetical protein
MKVKLFQKNREPYFWTVDDLNKIEQGDKFKHSFTDNYEFTFNGVNFFVTKSENDNDFISDGLNIIVTSDRINLSEFMEKYQPNFNFLLVIKTIEDYWYSGKESQQKVVDYISSNDHIKVIWDIPLVNFKNFYFEPKMGIQNYYNHDFAFPSNLFLYGNDAFENIRNKKRVGFHVNKCIDKVRRIFSEKLFNITHENLFFTVSDCFYNQKHNIRTNYTSNIFDCEGQHTGVPQKSYIDFFFNQSIKSEIELIYETFTTTSPHLQFVKWNEKTIKNLYLGKPFVHIDPLAHKLMHSYGFKPYYPLFTDELLNVYENYDTNILLDKIEPYWLDILEKNLFWLLNMNQGEWEERLSQSKEIARKNRELVFELIFNKSLFSYILK